MQAPEPEEVTSGRRWLTVAAAFLIGCVVVAVYWKALSFEFLRYDDATYTLDNPLILSPGPASVIEVFTRPYFRSYTPLALISHALDHLVWGHDPRGHHLMSVLVHAANAVMVFVLCLRVNARGSVSHGARLSATVLLPAAAALGFALHPMRVESVAWIADRKDLEMAAFLLLSFMTYLRSRDLATGFPPPVWRGISVAFFALAVLSKSSAVGFPLVIVMADAVLDPSSRTRRGILSSLGRVLPYAVVSLVGLAVAFAAGAGYTNPEMIVRLTDLERFALPFYTLGFYVWKTLVPSGLTPFYTPLEGAGYAALSILGAAVIAACLLPGRRGMWGPALVAGSALAMLAPTVIGSLSFTGIQPWADRYTYAAVLALFVAGQRWRALSTPIGRAIVVPVLCAWGVLSFRQADVWRTSASLWGHVVQTSPSVPKGHSNMGALRAERGEYGEAIAYYRAAITLKPDYAEALNNMGLAYAALGALDSAECYHRRAIRADSSYVEAYTSYGSTLIAAGRLTEALEQYRVAIRLDPFSAKSHYNAGVVFYKLHKAGEALGMFRRAVELDSLSARAFLGLGIVLADLDSLGASRKALGEAARLGSEDARRLLQEHATDRRPGSPPGGR